MLIEGHWTERDNTLVDGVFVREGSRLDEPFELALDARPTDGPRYWLVASLSCPWSHRTTITRAILGLERHVGLHLAHGPRVQGYAVDGGAPWSVPGTSRAVVHVHQLYTLSLPEFTGRATVPVLWDAHERRILSDDSGRIMRALNASARSARRAGLDLCPESRRAEIDALNARVHEGLSNGVYRAGFAETQAAYDAAVSDVFATLEWLEARLSRRRFVLGSTPTEADWRVFPTLVRFDAVYHVLHRCCRKRLTDYPALWAYARDLYAWPGVAATVDFAAIRDGSYRNDTANNPHRIVPVQPEADWGAAHRRARLAGPSRSRGRDGAHARGDARSRSIGKMTR